MGILASIRGFWRAFRFADGKVRVAGTSDRIDNIAAASRDYGVSYFSGEVDELASAGDGYRLGRKRRKGRPGSFLLGK